MAEPSVEALLGLAELQEGDRVVLNPSGECRLCTVLRDPSPRGTGRITAIAVPTRADGHPYWVTLDTPMHDPREGSYVITVAMARSELTRL